MQSPVTGSHNLVPQLQAGGKTRSIVRKLPFARLNLKETEDGERRTRKFLFVNYLLQQQYITDVYEQFSLLS